MLSEGNSRSIVLLVREGYSFVLWDVLEAIPRLYHTQRFDHSCENGIWNVYSRTRGVILGSSLSVPEGFCAAYVERGEGIPSLLVSGHGEFSHITTGNDLELITKKVFSSVRNRPLPWLLTSWRDSRLNDSLPPRLFEYRYGSEVMADMKREIAEAKR